MKITVRNLLCLFFLATAFSCKKPYAPVIVSADHRYLVVEGVINSGNNNDTTLIKLSRTVKLNSTTNNPESGARVTVESDKNDQFPLHETGTGNYVVLNLNLPIDRNYRLHIFTSDNKEYASDFVENKITPQIDSVYYAPLLTGVQFYVSSHDNTNKTRYYRWDYGETWSYNSKYYAPLLYKDNYVASRNSDSLVSTCYKNAAPSNSVFVATSNKLGQDVISQYPLGYVDGSTGKITHVYSLLVKQYALTSDAYKYWTLLKTNTENLGSIFDPEPSSSFTNIHAVGNPTEPIIGYVSVSTVTTKRMFLQGRKLPFAVSSSAGQPTGCSAFFFPIQPQSTFDSRLRHTFASGDSLLTISVNVENVLVGYQYAPAICADCRLQGGTIVKPPYWPSDQ
ncbi:DUF4249 domain-containing protein [Mucilaginibacter sp. McL0603]|uniref:DUF4249 domain-containing protein n=1 Tax=Mucilaginibacter sp. McL0603 TaxID=3415670 RepID=UPI003CE8E87C